MNLNFYEDLNIKKTNETFRGYAMSYKVDIVKRKDPILQLETGKSSIRNLFSNLLNEIKGFKYQITAKVLFKKYKLDEKIEFRPIYFKSTTKAVIRHKFFLENSFQENLYRTDNWINEGSGWIVESIESQYINNSTYRPSSGGSYVELPGQLRSSKTGLINIKNKDQKCFLWCHVRHINPAKPHPEKTGKIAEKLHYDEINFPEQENDFG